MTNHALPKRLFLLLPAVFIVGSNFIFNTDIATNSSSFGKNNFKRPVTAPVQLVFESADESADESGAGLDLVATDPTRTFAMVCKQAALPVGSSSFPIVGLLKYSTASRAPPIG